MRILLVDDEPISLEALRHVLTSEGYDVTLARDGEEAFARIREESFRLVITDWEMPALSGVELCRRIRAGDFPGYVYIILLTSYTQARDVVEGLSAGADDFIKKPFDPAELRVRVRAGERILALETREMAIFAMAKLAESRDPETGAHLERVRSFARAIARRLEEKGQHKEIDSEYTRLVYLTSPLHDIGKVGLPDHVLLKPGRLDDREYAIMKTHTTIGAEVLEAELRQYPDAKFLRMAHDIALTHHERFDGGGYPQGLSGEDIPLAGRIVALADVYDALTSKRVYKEAFAHDVAFGMIRDESGEHFDPRVVDAFIDREGEFIEIGNRFKELELSLA